MESFIPPSSPPESPQEMALKYELRVGHSVSFERKKYVIAHIKKGGVVLKQTNTTLSIFLTPQEFKQALESRSLYPISREFSTLQIRITKIGFGKIIRFEKEDKQDE